MASSIFEEEHRQLVEILVSARKGAGLTQKGLGVRLGKSQSFVSLIERRQRRVDVVEFLAIGRALGLDAQVLLRDLLAKVEDPSK